MVVLVVAAHKQVGRTGQLICHYRRELDSESAVGESAGLDSAFSELLEK